MLWRDSGWTLLLVQDNVIFSDNTARGQCSSLSLTCDGGAIAAYDSSTLSLGAGCSLVNNRYAGSQPELSPTVADRILLLVYSGLIAKYGPVYIQVCMQLIGSLNTSYNAKIPGQIQLRLLLIVDSLFRRLSEQLHTLPTSHSITNSSDAINQELLVTNTQQFDLCPCRNQSEKLVWKSCTCLEKLLFESIPNPLICFLHELTQAC
jgi:hypothetical protein